MKYFLPHTAANTASYYTSLEQKKFPELSAQRQAAWSQAKGLWNTGVAHMEMAGHQTKEALSSGVERVEKNTGLKIATVVPVGTVPTTAPERADKAKLV